jgi:hypothetical protein
MPDTMFAKMVSKMRKSIIMKDYHLVCGMDHCKYCSSDEDEKYIYSSSSGGEEDDA